MFFSESRIPPSVRSAVSPRRSFRQARQWPPPPSAPTPRYWQISPAMQFRKKDEHEPLSLHDLIELTDREESESPKPARRARPRRDRQRAATAPVGQIAHSKIFEKNRTGDVAIKQDVAPHREEEVSTQIFLDKAETTTRVQGIVSNFPLSAELRTQCPAEKQPSTHQIQVPADVPDMHLSEPEWDTHSIQADVPLDQFETSSSLHVPHTIDSSTSPIPTIELPRRKSLPDNTSHDVNSDFIRALSPCPFKVPQYKEIMLEPITEVSTEPARPVIRTPQPSEHLSLLVGINTTPRPFVKSRSEEDEEIISNKSQPQKKVDFSKPTVILSAWRNVPEVVDESDIVTEIFSPASPVHSPPVEREGDSEMLNSSNAQYDGDESDIYDNRSENGSIANSEKANLHQRWIQEEEELTRKEEMEEVTGARKAKEPKELKEPKEEWRQHAMSLLNDESQTERDYAIVAALNERLQGLRDMEEADRQKAIECIERHQKNLEEQQDQLSVLLDSAIAYLRNLDTSKSSKKTSEAPLEPPKEEIPIQPSDVKSTVDVKVDR
ncbi:unnamed protein product [Cylicostephanus goldi]|uniref:Uncharacterized protein n=1 Tax=Cylicostephanus goldi TaxID=71465 RepID=A0A3P6QR36_CYLGO|nr:unnamed protein product [Cylicostephanus goldi]